MLKFSAELRGTSDLNDNSLWLDYTKQQLSHDTVILSNANKYFIVELKTQVKYKVYEI